MALGAEAAGISDLRKTVGVVLQKLAGQLHPLADNVLPYGHAHNGGKILLELTGTHVIGIGQLADGWIFFRVGG